MSKVLKDTEVLAIVQRIITGMDVIDDADTHARFLFELGELIAGYCGGDCIAVSRPSGDDDDLGWCVHFHANDSVPDDGGVYAAYDVDVDVEEWRQDANRPDEHVSAVL